MVSEAFWFLFVVQEGLTRDDECLQARLLYENVDIISAMLNLSAFTCPRMPLPTLDTYKTLVYFPQMLNCCPVVHVFWIKCSVEQDTLRIVLFVRLLCPNIHH